MTARSDIEATRFSGAPQHVVTTAPYDSGVSAESGVTKEDRRHRKKAAEIRKANSAGNLWELKRSKQLRTDKPSPPDYPEHPRAKVAPLYRAPKDHHHKENIAYRLKLHRKKTPEERMKFREEAFSDRHTPATKKRKATCFYFYDTHPIDSPKAKYGKSEVGEIVGGSKLQ